MLAEPVPNRVLTTVFEDVDHAPAFKIDEDPTILPGHSIPAPLVNADRSYRDCREKCGEDLKIPIGLLLASAG